MHDDEALSLFHNPRVTPISTLFHFQISRVRFIQTEEVERSVDVAVMMLRYQLKEYE